MHRRGRGRTAALRLALAAAVVVVVVRWLRQGAASSGNGNSAADCWPPVPVNPARDRA
ncbi:MAG: hypothetical protein WBG41_05995 [Acidimicrobiales bacterium]